MMLCSCGADQFTCEKLVRPAGLPVPPYHTPLADRTPPTYRYRCAHCGALYGEGKHEAQPKNPVTVDEGPPIPVSTPAPKRRGRPPKNAK